MKIFLIIVSIILAVIIGLTLICIGFLFNKNSRKKIRLAIFLTDIFLIVCCISINYFNSKFQIPNYLFEILGDVMTIIFMSQLICIVTVMIALMIRSVYRFFNKPAPFSRERRRILAYSLFYPLYSFVTATYANQIERNDTVENFFDIPIKNLPAELNNFKIAQISDIHLGAFYSLDKLKELLNQIVKAQPDLLTITGDIFDSVEVNEEAIKIVDSYCDKFKYGIFYCHGNHEHHRGIKLIEEKLSQTKIHWLVNQSQNVIKNLYIVGVDYPMSAPVMRSKDEVEQNNFNLRKKKFLTQAMQNVEKNSICILLAHHPEFIDDAVDFKIPLTLTGHTHGSQIGFFGLPLFPVFKYTRGMFQHDNCYGYVHVGNGSWFPFRLGCPPEIAYFTLKTN